jgi:hypothetical protein
VRRLTVKRFYGIFAAHSLVSATFRRKAGHSLDNNGGKNTYAGSGAPWRAGVLFSFLFKEKLIMLCPGTTYQERYASVSPPASGVAASTGNDIPGEIG